MTARYVDIAMECVLSNGDTIYNSVNAVPKDVETDVVSYTVPTGRSFILAGGSGSGWTYATFRLYVDGNVIEVKRNVWTERNVDFAARTKVDAGKVIKITVDHYGNGGHDFDASIFGILL